MWAARISLHSRSPKTTQIQVFATNRDDPKTPKLCTLEALDSGEIVRRRLNESALVPSRYRTSAAASHWGRLSAGPARTGGSSARPGFADLRIGGAGNAESLLRRLSQRESQAGEFRPQHARCRKRRAQCRAVGARGAQAARAVDAAGGAPSSDRSGVPTGSSRSWKRRSIAWRPRIRIPAAPIRSAA